MAQIQLNKMVIIQSIFDWHLAQLKAIFVFMNQL